MKKLLILCVLFSFVLLPQPKGKLLIIGGGSRPEYMMKKFIELAGGYDAKIVIVPNASSVPKDEAWDHSTEFVKLGCKNVKALYFGRAEVDSPQNLAELNGVTGVFFSGGDQAKLFKEVGNSKFIDKIKAIYNNGGIIGGTSAGAAVMSKVMITGEELIVKDSTLSFFTVHAKNVETTEGFGFLTDVIIDQHFLVRKRQNRLITTTIEHNLPGIGIDESTAILVDKGRYFTVVGESGVLVIDPTKGKRKKENKNGMVSATDITMHLLMDGDRYDMKTRKVLSK